MIGNMLNVYKAQISHTIKINALKDVKQRRVVNSYLRFDGSMPRFSLKVKAIGAFETSVISYQTTQCYHPIILEYSATPL
jgi:hypothetical protein